MDAVAGVGPAHDDGERVSPGDSVKRTRCSDLGFDQAPGDCAPTIPKDDVVSVHTEEQNLALVSVLDSEQWGEPRRPRPSERKHMDSGAGAEFLTDP